MERGVGGDSRSSLLGVLLGGKHLFVSICNGCEVGACAGKDTGGVCVMALETNDVSRDTTTLR